MGFLDEVNDRDNPYDGSYLVKVTDASVARTKGGENAKLPEGCKMYKVTYSILEPEECVGMEVVDRFAVGRKGDLDAKNIETWKDRENYAAKSLKRFLKGAQAPLLDDIDQAVLNTVGHELMIRVKNKESGGFVNCNVSRYGQIGSFAPVITENIT